MDNLPLFIGIVLGLLAFDAFVLNRGNHTPSLKKSIWQTVFWISLAVGFGVFMILTDKTAGIEYFGVYVTEKLLSLDNLFVILIIFRYFAIEPKYQHKVLYLGILGVIILRGILIGAGALLLAKLSFILYIFGAILVYTGITLLTHKGEKEFSMEKSRILQAVHKIFKFTDNHHSGKFFLIENGKRVATSLFAALIIIELSDLVFALDSIPASFSITQNSYVIFTANIAAALGLRSLFFIVEDAVKRFHFISYALAYILLFIGVKMFLPIFGLHISSLLSLSVILSIIFVAIIASLRRNMRTKKVSQ